MTKLRKKELRQQRSCNHISTTFPVQFTIRCTIPFILKGHKVSTKEPQAFVLHTINCRRNLLLSSQMIASKLSDLRRT